MGLLLLQKIYEVCFMSGRVEEHGWYLSVLAAALRCGCAMTHDQGDCPPATQRINNSL